MAKYPHDRTRLLDWIKTNCEIKDQAKKNLANTEYDFKPYNQAYPGRQTTPPPPPREPLTTQWGAKTKRLDFVRGSALALG